MTQKKYNEIIIRIGQLRRMKVSQWEKTYPAPVLPPPITVKERVGAMLSGRYVLADPIPEGSGWNTPTIDKIILMPEEVAYAVNKEAWIRRKDEFTERLDNVISEIKDTLLMEDLAQLSPLLLQLKAFEV